MSTGTEQPVLRSPKRCLLASAVKGRARWKHKAQQRSAENKVLKVRVYDLERSRDRHAEVARQTHQQLQQAQQTIEQLRGQLASAQEALKKK